MRNAYLQMYLHRRPYLAHGVSGILLLNLVIRLLLLIRQLGAGFERGTNIVGNFCNRTRITRRRRVEIDSVGHEKTEYKARIRRTDFVVALVAVAIVGPILAL